MDDITIISKFLSMDGGVLLYFLFISANAHMPAGGYYTHPFAECQVNAR